MRAPARVLVALLALWSGAACASYLSGRYEQAPYAEALARVRAQPERHVLIYFGMYRNCPPCQYTQLLLNSAELVEHFKPNYVVVSIDLRNPADDELAVIARHKARWAPTLVFLDAGGRVVQRLSGGFSNQREALLANEFISRKLYRRTDLKSYVAANFDAAGAARSVPQTKPPDPRIRLREVLTRNHEQLGAAELHRGLPDSTLLHTVYRKDLQVFDQRLELRADGTLDASSRNRATGRSVKGAGGWSVRDDGRLCMNIAWPGSAARWCRTVLRVGEDFYTVDRVHDDAVVWHFTYAAE